MIFLEQLLIMLAGISTGLVSGMIATMPSMRNYSDIPFLLMIGMIAAMLAAGVAALNLALRPITSNSLIAGLRKE
jgi:hypothetical protein